MNLSPFLFCTHEEMLQSLPVECCIVKTPYVSTGGFGWDWIDLNKTCNLKVISFVSCNKHPLLGLQSIGLCYYEEDVFLVPKLLWKISEATSLEKKN